MNKRVVLFSIGIVCFLVANFLPDFVNQFSLDVGGTSVLNNLGQTLLSLIGGVIVCKAIFKE